MQQLEGALGGARIAIGEADVGVDDADQRHVGKIVALGDQLRADDNVRLAPRDGLQLQPHPFDAAHNVGREHDNARVRKMRGGFFRQPLNAGAAGDEMVERAAFGAGFRALFLMAAMVAHELALEPVLDQPARAVFALETVAADPAQRQRRIAAPVQEQQRLLAARQRLLHRGQQHRRNEAAALRRMAAHVNCVEVRQVRLGKAARQPQMPVAAMVGVDAAFDRGRRRDEDDRKVPQPPAHHGHVARRIGHAVLLLVGRVMLLIDDDQPQLLERQIQRRARAGDNAHIALGHLPPDFLAHFRRKVRMPFARLGAEPVLKALDEGGGQGDFRQQDQRLFPGVKRGGDGFEIDFGFARAGHAVEKRDGKRACLDALSSAHRWLPAGPADSSVLA